MGNITLALDDTLSREVRAHPEIRWSEVARAAFRLKINELHALDAALANSKLTEAEVRRLARKANVRLLKRLVR